MFKFYGGYSNYWFRGFFGKNLCKYFREKEIKFKKTDLNKVNLTSIDETKKLITKVSPKIIINCATGHNINKTYEPLVLNTTLECFLISMNL